MKPSLVKATLKARFEANIHRTPYVIGPPGLGKTQIMAQIASELGVGFKALHAPTLQPEDIAMPVISSDRGSVRFVVPTERFPMESSDCHEAGILLIDELPQSDSSTQKTMANLIQEREIHGHKIKDKWMIVATGNRKTDGAGANRVLTHLMNRMTEINMEPDFEDWCAWYMRQPDMRVEGLSFIRFKPNLLCDFNPQRDVNPTPRAWVEGVFASLGAVPAEAELEVFKGDVGEGPASEFKSFLNIYRNLPDPDEVIANPVKHKMPTEPSVLFALSGALATRATKANFAEIMKFANRMPPEFCAILVKDALNGKERLDETKAFTDWALGAGSKLWRD